MCICTLHCLLSISRSPINHVLQVCSLYTNRALNAVNTDPYLSYQILKALKLEDSEILMCGPHRVNGALAFFTVRRTLSYQLQFLLTTRSSDVCLPLLFITGRIANDRIGCPLVCRRLFISKKGRNYMSIQKQFQHSATDNQCRPCTNH
ncbi:hypothetical protein GALMADRAFT_1158524 [Galerina marginata CBS 339.88]|uniref:Uncharacterized protein n=1 Tax=Galerina marginata (strain CBS 339.88) TaxID=685588 RepID=A0A067SF51_GALM3|nr:hypothetical protein GALMADRAFT_1158524 [Galerina marginata CBS 339.88]